MFTSIIRKRITLVLRSSTDYMISDYAQVTPFNKRFLTLLIDDDFTYDHDLTIDEFEAKGDPNHYCIEDKTEVSLPLRVTLSLLGR